MIDHNKHTSASRLHLEPTRAAFSLVELLVCVGVVGVLLGLVLSSLASGRMAARKVACMAQLRQFGVAISSYMDANDGIIPFADDYVDVPAGLLNPLPVLADALGATVPRSLDPDHTDAAPPWRCPDDPVVAKRYGTSYRYEPWVPLSLMGTSGTRALSRAIANDPRYPLMRDLLGFHQPQGSEEALRAPGGRNTLRSDGSVTDQLR